MNGTDGEQFSSPEARVLAAMVTGVKEDVGEMKAALTSLATAINKLTLIEQRQLDANAAMQRAFAAIDRVAEIAEARASRVEKRLGVVEGALPPLQEMRGWVVRCMLAGVALILLAVAQMVLIRPDTVAHMLRPAALERGP